jgi:hypothetical protein
VVRATSLKIPSDVDATLAVEESGRVSHRTLEFWKRMIKAK